MRTLLFLLFIAAMPFILADRVSAQRDYLTPEEVELVRDAQEIDRRIDVLTKAIDRRFDVMGVNVGGMKFSEKDVEKWGDLPKGTKTQLILDIKRILQKAVDDIDDIAQHNMQTDTDKNFGGKLFPRAVRNLAAAAKRYQPALRSELDNTKDNADKGPIMDSLDLCDQIVEAVAKLPAEETKKSGKN
jgi:hypothetical protein